MTVSTLPETCGLDEPVPAADRAPRRPTLSVVVPLHNEEDNVEAVYVELHDVLTETGLDYEVVFVDDGSTDRTLRRLCGACGKDRRVVILELRRNFGQTAAMAAGFDRARGRVLVPMDGDLQNDPRDIPALLAKLEEAPGYDVVSGWRRNRQDKWLTRRVPSALANRLIRYSTGVPLHDFGCTLKMYRREILDDIHLYGELHRFLPALAAAEGARIAEIPVNHRPRRHGKTKYGMRRTLKVLLDLVTIRFLGDYMTKPLYFFGKLASYLLILVVLLGAVAVGQKFGHWGYPEGLHLNRNILVGAGAVLLILAAQCIVLGVVSELLVRIYHESQDRPTYRLRHVYQYPAPAAGDAAGPDREHRPSGAEAPGGAQEEGAR